MRCNLTLSFSHIRRMTLIVLLTYSFMIRVYSQDNITIHNKFQDPSNPPQYGPFENFTYVDGQAIYPTGTTLNLSGIKSFHTESPTYSGAYQGYNHKFSRWQDDRAQFTFTILPNVSGSMVRQSYLDATKSAYFHTSFEDESIYADQGVIKFIDPWYIYGGPWTYSQPYINSPNTYTTLSNWNLTGEQKGIFTGVTRSLQFPNIPYYSVQVPRFYEANGTTPMLYDNPQLNPLNWIFIQWNHSNNNAHDGADISARHATGYTERAITFDANNASSTAWYKAHLFSNLPQDIHPTDINSQRKIDVDESGVYHAVYESSNEIWYMKSTDNGSSWSKEELVSDWSGNNHRPCIAEFSGTVYITYVGNDDEVVLKKKSGSGQWEYIWGGRVFTTSLPNPVVEISNNCPGTRPAVVCVVWEDKHNNINYLKYYVEEIGGSSLEGNIVASQDSFPRYPSIATKPNSNSFSIAWKDSSDIRYTDVIVWHCNQFFVVVLPIEKVNHYIEVVLGPPSITIDFHDLPTVAYENATVFIQPPGGGGGFPILSYNPKSTLTSSSKVAVRQRSYSFSTSKWAWNTTASTILYGSYDYGKRKPSIGSQPLNNVCPSTKKPVGLRVVYNGPEYTNQLPDGEIRVMKIVDPVSCNTYIVTQGCAKDPNIVGRSELYGKLHELFCHSCDTLNFTNYGFQYLIHDIWSSNYQLGKTNTLSLNNIREAYISKDTATAAFTIRKPRVFDASGDSSLLSWDVVHDTLVVGTNATLDDKMQTESFIVPSQGRFVFDKESFVKNAEDFPQASAFVVRFRNTSNGEIILSEDVPIRNLPSDSSEYSSHEISLSDIEDKNVYMTLGVTNDIDTLLISVNDVYTEQAAIEKRNIGNKQNPSIPSVVTLSQNYPNPFGAATLVSNPSTEIAYSLPEGSDVKLNVIDALGREVAILVNEYKEPGMYAVIFNGVNLPSGVYYYRLVAGENILTRSMSLVK